MLTPKQKDLLNFIEETTVANGGTRNFINMAHLAAGQLKNLPASPYDTTSGSSSADRKPRPTQIA